MQPSVIQLPFCYLFLQELNFVLFWVEDYCTYEILLVFVIKLSSFGVLRGLWGPKGSLF